MLNAQAVNIGIVCDALLSKILADIGTIGAKGLTELCQCEVVLKVEFRLLTVSLEKSSDIYC